MLICVTVCLKGRLDARLGGVANIRDRRPQKKKPKVISGALERAGACHSIFHVVPQFMPVSCKYADRRLLLDCVQTKYLPASVSAMAAAGARIRLASQVATAFLSQV